MAPESSSISAVVWTILNLIAFGASAFLAIDLVVASDNVMERRGAVAFYLVWDFGTTVLWVAEVSFRALAWRKAGRENDSVNDVNLSSIALIVEWSLAIFFTGASIRTLIKWRLKKGDINAEMIEVVLNTAAYAYISIATFRDNYESRTDGQYTPVPEAARSSIV